VRFRRFIIPLLVPLLVVMVALALFYAARNRQKPSYAPLAYALRELHVKALADGFGGAGGRLFSPGDPMLLGPLREMEFDHVTVGSNHVLLFGTDGRLQFRLLPVPHQTNVWMLCDRFGLFRPRELLRVTNK
jgi:hypothetical protein